MDDKVFELMTKIYSELIESRRDMAELKTSLMEVKAKITRIEIFIENEERSRLELGSSLGITLKSNFLGGIENG